MLIKSVASQQPNAVISAGKIKQIKFCDLFMSLQSQFLYVWLIKVAEDIIYTDHAY